MMGRNRIASADGCTEIYWSFRGVEDVIVDGDRVFCSPQRHRPFQNTVKRLVTRSEADEAFGVWSG